MKNTRTFTCDNCGQRKLITDTLPKNWKRIEVIVGDIDSGRASNRQLNVAIVCGACAADLIEQKVFSKQILKIRQWLFKKNLFPIIKRRTYVFISIIAIILLLYFAS